jgi:hypothetical protein
MASIVGTWDWWIFWSGEPAEYPAPDITFNANGTWTAGLPHPNQHHGWWLQSGDLAIWLDQTAPGIVFSANIRPGLVPQEESMAGIMSWLNPGGLGTFRAWRFVPDEVVGTASGAVPEGNSDPLLGPVVDPISGDSSDRAAQGSS